MKILSHHKNTSIRFQLAVLVFVAVLPVWLVAGFLVIHSYNAKCEQIRKNMLATAQLLSMVVDQELSSVQAALLALATSPTFASGDFASVHRQALQLLKSYPGADIIVADVSGQQVVNSYLPFGSLLPRRNNPETIRRIFETGKPVISDLFYGALTKKPLISIDIPVICDGKIAYDLAMTFSSSRIASVLLQQQLPPNWIGIIMDSKSILVARSRYPEMFVGKRVNSTLSRAITHAPEGFLEDSSLEGKTVFTSFYRSAVSTWGVVVAVPESSVMVGIYQWVGWAVTGSSVLSLFGIAAALGLGRRIARAEEVLALSNQKLGQQSEAALRLSEQEFRSLAEAMPQIVWATRPDGWNIYFNQHWADYTGLTMEESYGHGWNLPFHPDDKQRAWDAWQLATQHNERYSLECRLRRADGVYRWWLIRGEPMRGANGEILKWFGTCTDIEDIKRAETALHEANALLEQRVAERTAALWESEQRFRLALKNSPVSVAVQDSNLVYQWAYNQQTRRPEEIIGKTDADLFAPDEVVWIDEIKKRVLETGIEEHAEHWVTSNGQRLFLDLSYEPLRNSAGEVTGIGIAVVNLTNQKLTEAALKESEEQFRTLADSIPNLTWWANSDGYITWYNRRWYEYTGTTPKQMEGWGWQSVHDPDELPKVLDRWHASIATGEPFEMTFPLRGADGVFRLFLTRISPRKDASGRVLQWFGTNTDVSELTQAEEARRESEERLRFALESCHIGAWDIDLVDNTAYRSLEHGRIFGYEAPLPEWTLDMFFQHVLPEYRAKVEIMIREATAAHASWASECRIRRTDGEIRWIWFSGRYTTDISGRSRAAGVVQDITERKLVEESLRKRERQLQDVIDGSPSPIFLKDLEGRFITINASLERMLGVSREDIKGKTDYDIVTTEVAEYWRDHDQKVVATAKATQIEEEADLLDGHHVFLANKFPLVDVDGQIYGIGAIAHDITDRKQAEKALETLNEELEERVTQRTAELREKDQMLLLQSRQAAMGEMIGNIAHQWRQPLNTLGLSIQQLKLFYELGEFTEEFLDQNVTNSMDIIQHMSKTIDDFKDYFKPDKEKVEFSICGVVESTLSLIEDRLKSKNIDVMVVANGDPSIHGFRNEFVQVLLNIFNNSSDAFTERACTNCKISITFGSVNGRAFVAVADNAGGIAEDIINKVFDPYFSTKGPQQGTGIGLYMAKAIIEKNMGGKLTVRNIAGGAEFRIEV